MAYRHDPDLEFLATCSSKELDNLVYLLTHDEKGKVRWTESLTSKEVYKRHYRNHNMYWKEIAEELQLFGGNTFRNLVKGGVGFLYKEILYDVCDKLKVNYNKYSATVQIEQNLLMKILQDALERMEPEELKKLAVELGVQNINFLSKETLTATFIAIFRAGGFKSYQLTVIIVNAILKILIGRGLSLAGNAALMRLASILTGPIGWIITAAWTAFDIAGPAYRVTIPAVIQVAYLRSLSENRKEIEEQARKELKESSANNSTETASIETIEKKNSVAPEISPEFFHFKKPFDKA